MTDRPMPDRPEPDRPDHRELLERMVSEQPDRLPRRMRPAADDPATAEDLAQEVLLRALRSIADLRGPAEEALVCGWVDTIAANLIRNHHRSRSRRPRTDTLDDTVGDTATTDPTPDALIEAEAARTALAGLVATLPEDQRRVFVARVLEDRSTADVAEELGISVGLVRWRLHAARERLRSTLEAELRTTEEGRR